MQSASAKTPLPPVLEQLDLRGDRLQAAQTADHNVLVLAGPGAGKTRLLCAHAGWLASQYDGIVRLLTFSSKAAAEMEARVASMLAGHPHAIRRVAASTLHSFAFHLLKSFSSKLGLPSSVEVLDRAGVNQIALESARELGISPINDFESWLDRLRRLGLDAKPPMGNGGHLLLRVEQKMRHAGLVDFGGQITWATQLLREFPMIRASIRHHNRFLLIDEAQDCDPAQLAFLEELVGTDGDVHLFVVLDPDQSLYGWRDADPERVIAWAENHRSIKYQLTENFRCSTEVSNLAKSVLDPLTTLTSLQHFRLYDANSSEDEAQFIHTQIRERELSGISYRRMAILSRASWRLNDTRNWLRDQGIPLLGGVQTEWTPREYRVLLCLFALEEWQSQVEPGPSSARFLREIVGMNRAQISELEDHAISQGTHPCDLLSKAKETIWAELILTLDKRLSPIAFIREIGTLLEIDAKELEQDGGLVGIARSANTIRILLRDVRRGPSQPKQDDGLLVATFHAAKGLEFDTVFVVGCEDGLIPDRRATTADRSEKRLLEERRALYVAITRAEKEVVFTWNSSKGQSLCRFLPPTNSQVWKQRADPPKGLSLE